MQLDTEEEQKTAARFVQRAWRAWKELKRFQNLQLSVTRLKLCMTKRVLWLVISAVRSDEENKLYDTQNPGVAAYLAEMEMMRKEASAALRLLQMDPFHLLEKTEWSSQGSIQDAAAIAVAAAAATSPAPLAVNAKTSGKLHVMHDIQEHSSVAVAPPPAVDHLPMPAMSRPMGRLLRKQSTFKTRRDVNILSVLRGGNVLKVLNAARMRLGVSSLCKADLLQQVEAAALLGFKSTSSPSEVERAGRGAVPRGLPAGQAATSNQPRTFAQRFNQARRVSGGIPSTHA